MDFKQRLLSRGSGAGNVFSDNTKFSQEHQGRRLPCKAGKRYRDLLINECGLKGIEKSRSGRTGPRTHSAAAASVNSAWSAFDVNTFSPESAYFSGGFVHEFRSLVGIYGFIPKSRLLLSWFTDNFLIHEKTPMGWQLSLINKNWHFPLSSNFQKDP